MNREKLIKTAKAIALSEVPDLGFNMTTWYRVINDFGDDRTIDRSRRGCGTVACGAGWTIAVHHGLDGLQRIQSRVGAEGIIQNAMEILGLTFEEADRLFYGSPASVIELEHTTPDQTVNTYLYAAEHGVVDWDAAQESPPPRPWEQA